MTWLFLRSADAAALCEEETEDLSATLAAVPALLPLKELAHEFLRLVRQRDAAALLPWLEAAAMSALGALKRPAANLRSDGAAVGVALEQDWSNGQVEGQVNRLKFVKRSITRKRVPGRASFDLLRARVLHQAS
jgi:transposase